MCKKNVLKQLVFSNIVNQILTIIHTANIGIYVFSRKYHLSDVLVFSRHKHLKYYLDIILENKKYLLHIECISNIEFLEILQLVSDLFSFL